MLTLSAFALSVFAPSVFAAGCYQSSGPADAGRDSTIDGGHDAGAPWEADAGEADAGTRDAGMEPPRTLCSPAGECDLLTGAGCPGGAKCEALPEGESYATRCLYEPADGDEGSACDGSHRCGPGLGCHSEGVCRAWCCLDADDACPSGQVCRPVDASIGFGLCTSGAGCDPVADTGCAAGLSCYFVVDAVSCYPSGSTAVGEPCTALTECVPGAMCVATPAGTRCRPTCRTTEDGCAEGERCVAFAPTTDWGACVAEWGPEP